MAATREPSSRHPERPLLAAGLTCCVALLVGLAAVAAAGSAPWLRGGLGTAGLILLGVGGGLLVAQLILEERGSRSRRRRVR
jgi:hypothetical protein